jgi:hypothetical protein
MSSRGVTHGRDDVAIYLMLLRTHPSLGLFKHAEIASPSLARKDISNIINFFKNIAFMRQNVLKN